MSFKRRACLSRGGLVYLEASRSVSEAGLSVSEAGLSVSEAGLSVSEASLSVSRWAYPTRGGPPSSFSGEALVGIGPPPGWRPTASAYRGTEVPLYPLPSEDGAPR